MIEAAEAVVWTNSETHEVRVLPRGSMTDRHHGWGDPIGASYLQWKEMSDEQRTTLMLETAIDLAMQGFDLTKILEEFAKVSEFKALGSQSYPMCRALTKALVGKTLEPNTMTFDELLEQYGRDRG
ncbi:hypothetical protein WDM22_24405 [Bradyrhizobium septentrionale]|uniref:hypothetical protein n=1 Tax=Bradyrhizobium septentrionale TaxID=1404411 RepID=UPI0030CEAC55